MIQKFEKIKKFTFIYLTVISAALVLNILQLETGSHQEILIKRCPEASGYLDLGNKADNSKTIQTSEKYRNIPFSDSYGSCRDKYNCSHFYFFTAGPSKDFWPFSVFKSEKGTGMRPAEKYCISENSFFGIFGGFGLDDFIVYLIVLFFIVGWKLMIESHSFK